MNRPVLAPAALAAAIAIPFLIGSQSASAPPAPAARDAALVVALDGVEGRERPYPLRVLASGEPGPTATLVDDGGLHAAHVGVADDAACADAPLRSTGHGGADAREWCLELTDVPEHEQVAGVVASSAAAGGGSDEAGAPTSLALTVTHRMAFDGWPLFLIVAGMLGSLAVTWLLLGLGRRVRGTRLERLVTRNEDADRATRIVGLRAWVARRRTAAGTDAEELLELTEGIVAGGPAAAREARAALGGTIDAATAGAATGYGLLDAARAEAARSTHAIGDFVDDDGTAVEHPAAIMRGQVMTMTALRAALDRLEQDVRSRIRDTPECRDGPVAALAAAIDAWADVADAAGLERAADAYEDALAVARTGWSSEVCATSHVVAHERTAARRGWLVAPPPAEPAVAPVATRLRALALATGAIGVGAFAVAALTVSQAVYAADATFGSWGDCLALLSAAAASSFAGTVAGLLSPWGIDLDG